ncbi:MAG: hypothetical protein ABUS56_13445 [Acidobacteriota bacterium]
MNKTHVQSAAGEWVTFPGGELEGRRPKVLCAPCREGLNRAAAAGARPFRPGTLCFRCYLTDLARDRALKAAGELNTASVERFQDALPFEPVNRPRLAMLKAERAVARTAMRQGTGQFADTRRQAQLAARRTLQRALAAGAQPGASNTEPSNTAPSSAAPSNAAPSHTEPARRAREVAAAIHAAELQLPESWMPFVAAR